MTHGPECPCCRVAASLSPDDQLKWAALRYAWGRLPIDATAQEIYVAAHTSKASVIEARRLMSKWYKMQ